MTHDDIRNDNPSTCFNDQCERDDIPNHYNYELNSEPKTKITNNCEGQSFCIHNQDNLMHKNSAYEICNHSTSIERNKKYKVSNNIKSDAFLNVLEDSEEKLN